MAGKEEIIDNRVELFMVTGELPLSPAIDRKIFRLLESSDPYGQEREAKAILEKLKGCKTEADVKQALEL